MFFSVFRKKETLFALNSAMDFIRESDMAIIVEGYMDVVSLFELG
jgi:DNA primase